MNTKGNRGLEFIVRLRQLIDHPFLLEPSMMRDCVNLGVVQELRQQLDGSSDPTPLLDSLEQWSVMHGKLGMTPVPLRLKSKDDETNSASKDKRDFDISALWCPVCDELDFETMNQTEVRKSFEAKKYLADYLAVRPLLLWRMHRFPYQKVRCQDYLPRRRLQATAAIRWGDHRARDDSAMAQYDA
jgi:hypothetical protein